MLARALVLLAALTASTSYAQEPSPLDAPPDAPALGSDDASAPVTPADFQSHLDAALADYEARRYREAAASFEAAYAIDPAPELQYNIARSLERALAREEAVAAYDRFLGLTGTTSAMRTRASRARDSLRAELDAMRRASAPVSPAPAPTPVTRSSSGDPDLSPIGWVMLGLGVASAGVGAVFGGLAVAANDDFYASDDRDEQILLLAEVDRYALLADILIGTGGALAIGGIVALVVSLADDEDEPARARVQLAPFAGPTGGGLRLSGSL